jgi:hypothetical protein
MIYSGTCASPDGTTVVSLRFLMTPEEYDFALLHHIIPEDTCLVVEMQQVDIAVHDIYQFPDALQ